LTSIACSLPATYSWVQDKRSADSTDQESKPLFGRTFLIVYRRDNANAGSCEAKSGTDPFEVNSFTL